MELLNTNPLRWWFELWVAVWQTPLQPKPEPEAPRLPAVPDGAHKHPLYLRPDARIPASKTSTGQEGVFDYADRVKHYFAAVSLLLLGIAVPGRFGSSPSDLHARARRCSPAA